MDPHSTSCILSNALGILKNVFKTRKQEFKHLDDLFKKSKKVDPILKTKLQRLHLLIMTMEEFLDDKEIRKLDLEFATSFVDIRTALMEGSPLRSSVRIAHQESPIEDSCDGFNGNGGREDQGPLIHPSRSPSMVRFSEVKSTTPPNKNDDLSQCFNDLYHYKPKQSSLDSRVHETETPIVVTKTFPDDNDTTCLLCLKKFLKRATLVEHLNVMHPQASARHDEIFLTYIDKDAPPAGLDCIYCDVQGLKTKKLFFRHLKKDHVASYNVFVNVLCMSGYLKDKRGFFMTIDNFGPGDVKPEESTKTPVKTPNIRLEQSFERLRVKTRPTPDLEIPGKTARKSVDQVTGVTFCGKKRKPGLGNDLNKKKNSLSMTPSSNYSLDAMKAKLVGSQPRKFIKRQAVSLPSNNVQESLSFAVPVDSESQTEDSDELSSSSPPLKANSINRRSSTNSPAKQSNQVNNQIRSLTVNKKVKKVSMSFVKDIGGKKHDHHSTLSSHLVILPEITITLPPFSRLTSKPPQEVTDGLRNLLSIQCHKCKAYFASESDLAHHELRFCRYKKPKWFHNKTRLPMRRIVTTIESDVPTNALQTRVSNNSNQSSPSLQDNVNHSSNNLAINTQPLKPPNMMQKRTSTSSTSSTVNLSERGAPVNEDFCIEIPQEESRIFVNLDELTAEQKEALKRDATLKVPVVTVDQFSKAVEKRLTRSRRFLAVYDV
jgi:hypothetical protein